MISAFVSVFRRLIWLVVSLGAGLLALGFAAVPLAQALESGPVVTPHAEVRLVSETNAIEPGKPFRLGLHFKMAKGWHIYWTNPGVAGEPPTIDFTLPAGAKASAIAFPVPSRVLEGPAMTYSYFDDVLLPLTITPAAAADTFPIKAKASWLICQNICVPESGTFNLTLPVGAAATSPDAPSPDAPLFEAADARMPQPSPYKASASADGILSLAGEDLSPKSVHEAWFFPAAWGEIDDQAPQALKVTQGTLSLALKPGQTFNPKDGLNGVLVLKDEAGHERYFTIAAPYQPAAVVAGQAKNEVKSALGNQTKSAATVASETRAPRTVTSSLLVTLAFAFLGGLILNLMPCVFPILAMKAMALARLSGHARGAVRAHAASYTLGVLCAFAALAALLLTLRAAGTAAGWGFQFQSPIFVAATAWLLFAIGLNLSGVFEVGGGFAQAGDGLTRRGGPAGSFFTGLLAVLVATPCTAPFMGVAIASAATATPIIALLIFLVMGLGLAAPYGVLVLVPAAARLLPRPGRWMLILRQALAFPMYGAAVWLVWVVAQEAGTDGLLLALSGAVLIGFAAWLLQMTQASTGRGRLWARAGIAAALIAAGALLANIGTSSQPLSTSAAAAENEMPYSASRLASLRAEGRPVFIDMTAAWCVTCLVNERVALASSAVQQSFAKHQVAYLKGDWTRADPEITQFLHDHNRDGVPLYVFYPPKGLPPIILPQILTETIVLNEVNRFGG